LVVSASANDSLERLVSEMTLIKFDAGTSNRTHSFIHGKKQDQSYNSTVGDEITSVCD